MQIIRTLARSPRISSAATALSWPNSGPSAIATVLIDLLFYPTPRPRSTPAFSSLSVHLMPCQSVLEDHERDVAGATEAGNLSSRPARTRSTIALRRRPVNRTTSPKGTVATERSRDREETGDEL